MFFIMKSIIRLLWRQVRLLLWGLWGSLPGISKLRRESLSRKTILRSKSLRSKSLRSKSLKRKSLRSKTLRCKSWKSLDWGNSVGCWWQVSRSSSRCDQRLLRYIWLVNWLAHNWLGHDRLLNVLWLSNNLLDNWLYCHTLSL